MSESSSTPRPGEWPSPVTAELIAQGGLRLAHPLIHDDHVYWLEGRASEQGRTVLMRRAPGGHAEDLTPPPFNVRSGAHEYGGGVYCIADDAIYFLNFEDHCLYTLSPGAAPRRLTSPDERRYADLCLDPGRRRVIAVCENHAAPGEPETTLVAIALDDGKITTLARGADFYSSPCLDPGGSRLAWLSWDHPDMPWDSTRLYTAELGEAAGELDARLVAGGNGESIFQPGWGADGLLYFMSDRSGWWNLQRLEGKDTTSIMHEPVDCGFGQWEFGMSTWGFIGPDEVLCCGAKEGFWSLGIIDIRARRCKWLSLPFNTCEHVATAPGKAALVAAGENQALSIISLDTGTQAYETLRESKRPPVDASWVSSARAISYPTSNGEMAHAFYYAPRHASLRLGQGEKPPLLVKCHGGPTAHTDAGLDWRIQFWTSRGFAILDINYRGSTGFGRAYREQLKGKWGVVDVEDAVNGARYLADKGLVDRDRMAISGGSAGGFTALSALTFHDTFRAGASLYGVSDLTSLLSDTHKFEARYLDRLVGPYPASEDLYRARSPLQHADRLRCPVLFLQGLRDKVVTPDQSERMAQALREKGLPVLYLTFPDEGHGFRQAESIITALEAELYFYARIFQLYPPNIGFAAHIENLD